MLKVIFYYIKMSKYKVHGSGQGAVSILRAWGIFLLPTTPRKRQHWQSKMSCRIVLLQLDMLPDCTPLDGSTKCCTISQLFSGVTGRLEIFPQSREGTAVSYLVFFLDSRSTGHTTIIKFSALWEAPVRKHNVERFTATPNW